MMVICEKHGAQPAMMISNDLVDAHGRPLPEINQLTQVRFDLDGTITQCYYVSDKRASELGFGGSTTLPFPEVFPEWTDVCMWYGLCTACYREAIERR